MVNYSIKDLERISGIKAHTLRIWEQRYNLLKPSRTDSNIRYYSNEDLKYILNISLLNRNGYKISKLAKLNYEEINQEVLRLFQKTDKVEEQVEGLVLAMIQFDEAKFLDIVDFNFNERGVIPTIEKILFPLLVKTGVMWQAGAVYPAQEHFISNLIRNKIIQEIFKIQTSKDGERGKVLLFLPEEEMHELSLLYYNYILRLSGYSCYYLGQCVPLEDVAKSYQIIQPQIVITIITQPLVNDSLDEYYSNLRLVCPDAKILVSGYQIYSSSHQSSDNPNIQFFKEAEELRLLAGV